MEITGSFAQTHDRNLIGHVAFEEADRRLVQWSAWAKQQSKTGYPGQCAIVEMIKYGTALPREFSMPLPENLEAEEIEGIVSDLPTHLKECCLVEYLGKGTRAQKAKDLHLNRVQYYQRVEQVIVAVWTALRVLRKKHNKIS